MIGIKTKGLKQLNQNIKEYGKASHRSIEKILLKAGFVTQRDARKRVPVQFGVLQRSITVNWSISGKNLDNIQGVSEPTFKIGEFKVKVGTNVKYAHMQEFGSWGPGPKAGPGEAPTTKGRSSRKRKRPSAGFLYLTRAFILNEKKVRPMIQAEFRKLG